MIRAIYEIEREINDLYKSAKNMYHLDHEAGSKRSNDYEFNLNVSREESKLPGVEATEKKGLKKAKSLQKDLNLYGNLRRKSGDEKKKNGNHKNQKGMSK